MTQQQQEQLSSTLHTQLKGLLGTGSPPQPAVSQASQAAQVLQGQAQPALPSSVLGNTPFLRQATQLLHQAGGGGAGGVGVQAQHLYPQSASQYPLVAAAERERQSLAAAREQEVLSNLAQRIRSNQLNPASAQLLRQGLNQIQSGVPVTAAPPLAPSGTASSITQQIQQIQIQQQLQELQQLQQLQKLGGLGGLASLPLSHFYKSFFCVCVCLWKETRPAPSSPTPVSHGMRDRTYSPSLVLLQCLRLELYLILLSVLRRTH